MSKAVLNILMTFDGYVAGLHDETDWIGGPYTPAAHQETFPKNPKGWDMSEFTSHVGAIIVGRRSYDLGTERGWFKDEAYGPSPIFVLSKDMPTAPSTDADFRFVTEGIDEIYQQASRAAGKKWIYIFGGPSVFQQLLNHGLVDELRITVAPLLLGKGIRLFDNLNERRINLQQLKVEGHPNSMYEVHYRIVK